MYGQSCSGFVSKTQGQNWVRAGNVTGYVQEACSGRNTTGDRCTFLVDNNRWGDPAQGCAKDFSVSYQCEGDQQPRTVTIAAEAAGKAVELDCYTRSEPTSGLNIRSATYGENCGAEQGNVTRELASSCNSKTDCAYKVDVNRLGDPAPKCGKDFVASYSCAPDATIQRKDIPAEAGFGSILRLSCTSKSKR
jgi:hypothetical protein